MENILNQLPYIKESREAIEIGKLSLCRNTHTLSVRQNDYHLRNKLFKLLEFLSENQNRLVPRYELIELIWDNNHYIGEKGLTHAICMLRNYIKKDPECGVSIETIPKTGYRLKVKEQYQKQGDAENAEDEEWRKVDTSSPSWWPSTHSFYSY